MDEAFNKSMRKFLRQVGVTSQQKIEEAVKEKGLSEGELHAKAVITVEELGLSHTVESVIRFEEE